MKISLRNYEAYLLDLSEGRLSDNDKNELDLFFKTHPELREEFQDNTNLSVKPQHVIFPNKRNLKKYQFTTTPVTNTNFHDFAIAYHENILDEFKCKELQTFLEDQIELEHDFNLYAKSYLTGDRIIYQSKNTLYKKAQSPVKLRQIYMLTAAASILIVFGFGLSLLRPSIHRTSLVNERFVNPKTLSETHPVVKNSKSGKQMVLNLTTVKSDVLVAASRKHTLNQPETMKIIAMVEKPDIRPLVPLRATRIMVKQDTKDSLLISENKSSPIHAIKQNSYANRQPELLVYQNQRKNQLTFFKIAKIGISGINRLTDSKIALKKSEDSQGNLNGLSFESEYIKFYKKVTN